MIQRLKNRHSGQRCVIICNGPSLNKTDFSLIRSEICIGLNKIFLGFKTFHFYPKYYVAVNEKVLRQSERQIKALTSVKFLSNRCPDLFSENALTNILETQKPHDKFCKDIQRGLEEGSTVTYAALQVAFFLGFQSVIIVGMDHKFDYEGAPNETKVMVGGDMNHFSDEYFGYGQKWDNPDLANSEKSYQIARNVFEQDGRQIIDATVSGACTIFEKQSLKDALKQ